MIPCHDAIDIHKNDSFSLQKIEHQHENDQHQNCESGCSAFCICSCCSSVFTIQGFIGSVITTLSSLPASHTHYSFDYSFEFHSGIWHPPTIC